jgi:hypothetical protein
MAQADTIEQAVADWKRSQLQLGRSLVERARRIGRRSQVDNAWGSRRS